jgi:hypothetical protein
MAGGSSPPRALISWRVWLVFACALVVVAFLGAVLPGVLDREHSNRSFEIAGPIERVVLDVDAGVQLDVNPSPDGRLHVSRHATFSHGSRFREQAKRSGKTISIRSSCTTSRLGLLGVCHADYDLLAPARAALVIRVHDSHVLIRGMRGRLDYDARAGDLEADVCSRWALIKLGFGRVKLHESCAPRFVQTRINAGAIELTVPKGRYAVKTKTRWGEAKPIENLIVDPSSKHRLDLEIRWGGSITVKGD